MTTSFTRTETETFNLSHAKHLASKVAADLYRCQARYGKPTVPGVMEYEQELVALLHGRYVERYEFGFRKDGKTLFCCRYNVAADGSLVADDNAGKIPSGMDTTSADFYNFLWFNSSWSSLSGVDRAKVQVNLPFSRTDGPAPAYGMGLWVADKSYSSGGVALSRLVFQPL
jgi:hypothetical protein